MTFRATVYVQGAGSYVPHVDDQSLCVLFPDTRTEAAKRLRDIEGDAICDHWAVVQAENYALNSETADWETLPLEKQWVSFSADGAEPFRIADAGLGLWKSDEVLEADDLDDYAAFNQHALPGGSQAEELLCAGVIVTQGVPIAHGKYQGPLRLHGGDRQPIFDHDEYATSVVKIDLGDVANFDLLLKPLGEGPIERIPLQSHDGELVVWIRHFCDLRPPRLVRERPPAGSIDLDFPVNFLLRARFDDLLAERGHQLPHPIVSSSWADGGPIGSDPARCGCTCEQAAAFANPMEMGR